MLHLEKPLLLPFPDIQQNASYMEATVSGNAATLSSPDSDVSLDLPYNAVYGKVVGRVFPDTRRFKHVIPENECLMSPLVMFETNFRKSGTVRYVSK